MGQNLLFSYTLDELQDHLVSSGFPKFSAGQIYSWIYKKRELNLDDWSNVSNKLKDYLHNEMVLNFLELVDLSESVDGTRKFLLKLPDGLVVETVYIPTDEKRETLCISSQVGCPLKCNFCLTGKLGFKRNLVVGEIVGQLMFVESWMRKNINNEFRISNIVFMGQGEPLLNFENVKKSLQIFMEDTGIGIGQRKITISSSGYVPNLEKIDSFPSVNIAISLHAVRDDVRSELMPINKKYNLNDLFETIRKIPLKPHRRITFEYLLIKDLNDGIQDIIGLDKLLDKKKSKINLIPFNEYENCEYRRPSKSKIAWFQKELLDRGFVSTIRNSKGSDILAACGQLANKN